MVRDAPKMKGAVLQFDAAIVLIVIAVLTAAGLAYFSHYTDSAKVSRCKSELSVLSVAVSQYAYEMHEAPTLAKLATTGTYPATDGVQYGPWIHTDKPKDPWGNEYILKITSDNKGFVVYSKGPDGGGSDLDPTDITSANNQQLGVFVENLANNKVGTIAYYGRFGDL